MSENYDEKDITVLKGTEGIRQRPAMYIGDTGSRGLHHLVYEVIDNSVDEAMANRCSSAKVTLHTDGFVSVQDDGAGIPADIHPEYGISTLELILTNLHSGGKFGKKAYKVSGGLHGVGLSAVCALSSEFYVKSFRVDAVYTQKYEKGLPATEVDKRDRNPDEPTGTIITFKPDVSIFTQTTEFSFEILAGRLKELAYLTEGFHITFRDERQVDEDGTVKEEIYHFEGGLKQFVADTIENRRKIEGMDIFYVSGVERDVRVEIALTYTESYMELIRAFVNNINTREGGTHVSGFKSGLTRTLNEFGRQAKVLKDKDENLRGDDTREGLVSVISVKVPNPQFEGQTKTKLGNSEVEGIVQSVFGKAFKEFLFENLVFAKSIVEKAVLSRKARVAAQKARDLIRKNSSSRVSLPGKLVSSRERDPRKRELFIVEGQSAGGTAVKARDAGFQEILFMRGKVLNVEKARMNKMLDNQEIRNIITAVGAGIDDEFDIPRVRYGKIVILTDADVDGQHIAVLLLTLFYRHMRPLFEEGVIYMARPPLYKITLPSRVTKARGGANSLYLYNDRDREALFDGFVDMDIRPSEVKINRFKGLGEMNADQLEETVMHVDTRRLDKVLLADLTESEKWVTTLMGDDVSGRKQFINKEVFNEADEFEKGEFYLSAFDDENEDPDETEEDLDENEDLGENVSIMEEQELLDQLEDWAQHEKFILDGEEDSVNI